MTMLHKHLKQKRHLLSFILSREISPRTRTPIHSAVYIGNWTFTFLFFLHMVHLTFDCELVHLFEFFLESVELRHRLWPTIDSYVDRHQGLSG